MSVGAYIFLKINLHSGYHPIHICDGDELYEWETIFKDALYEFKTTFKEGLYEWLVMVVGFFSVPATFTSYVLDLASLGRFIYAVFIYFDDNF